MSDPVSSSVEQGSITEAAEQLLRFYRDGHDVAVITRVNVVVRGLLAEVQRLQKELELQQRHGKSIAEEYRDRWQASEATVSRLTAEREQLQQEHRALMRTADLLSRNLNERSRLHSEQCDQLEEAEARANDAESRLASLIAGVEQREQQQRERVTHLRNIGLERAAAEIESGLVRSQTHAMSKKGTRMEPTGNGVVGFIARELDRIAVALRKPQPAKRYSELYAAQQALSWAIDPENFASPMVTIEEGRIVVPTDTQGD